MNMIIRNGRLVDAKSGMDRIGDLLLRSGKVSGIISSDFVPDGESAEFDAAGLVVCPGFIDLHCHLRQPGFEEKETIATGTAAALAGGFTTVCCMPNTEPPLDTVSAIEQVLSVASREGKTRVLPIGCVTSGRRGEGLADLGALARAGAVGFSDDGSPVAREDIMRQALEASAKLRLPVIDHCEVMSLSAGGVMNDGPVSVRLNHRGIPAGAEEEMVARDIELAPRTGGNLHLAHLSTAGSVELVRRARADGVRVTCEVTPHHLTLTEEAVVTAGTMAKVNPPLRTRPDLEALVAGLMDGTIDAIATDHAPHTAADKDCSFDKAAFGISGFETALGSLMTLVHRGEIDLLTLIAKLTAGPAGILGRADIGSLREGCLADITIFDPNAEWVVEPERFHSKGRNTPLAGVRLKGRVMATILGGRLVHDTRPPAR